MPQGNLTADHPTVCAWNEDEDGMLHTDCGKLFECLTDTPPVNGFKFCIYCGKLIAYCSYQPESEHDDE